MSATHPTPRQRAFQQVDVFTNTPYKGNPLAVVLDGEDLTDAQMQQFARWTHLSETTFVLPPTPQGLAAGAHYRVRIFTPGNELPFAGHPTLGTCHAWLKSGGPATQGLGDTVVQECAQGLVRIALQGGMPAFAAPPLVRSEPDPAVLAEVILALGLSPAQVQGAQVLDNGPVWLGLLVDSAEALMTLDPDHARLKTLGQKVGVAHIGRAQPAINSIADAVAADAPGLTVRAFAAPVGITEDPVTGSLNASLAQWLIADGLAPARYVAAQGECLGRAGRVHIRRDEAGQVWVGGHSVTCIDGTVLL